MSAPSTDPDWVEVFTSAIEAEVLNLHTGLPGKIVSYDPATQSASVKPLLKRAFVDPTDETREVLKDTPIISQVPICFPAGGGWSFTFDLEPGDVVYLAFAERSLDRWLAAPAGQSVDPVEARRHHLSDAVAFPGIRQRMSALAGAARPGMRLGKDDGTAEVQVLSDGTVLIKSPRVLLAGEAGAPVARVGDAVLITDPAFLAWATAVGANPLVAVPFPGAAGVAGVVQSGSSKVSSE